MGCQSYSFGGRVLSHRFYSQISVLCLQSYCHVTVLHLCVNIGSHIFSK